MLLSLPVLETVAAAGAVGGGAAAWLYQRLYVAVPPNRALVLFGRRSAPTSADGDRDAPGVVARSPRVLVGGGTMLAPWNRAFAYLSLAPVDAEVTVRTVHSLDGGAAAGWELALAVQAQVATAPEALRAAATSLFGLSAAELEAFVRRAVETSVPVVLSRLGIADAEPDWDRLAAEIQATVAPELVPHGLVVRTVGVRSLRRIAGTAYGTPSDRGRSGPARSASGPSDLDERLDRIERGLTAMSAQVERWERDRLAEAFDEYPILGSGPSAGDGAVHDSMQGGRPGRPRVPAAVARTRATEAPPTASDAETVR